MRPKDFALYYWTGGEKQLIEFSDADWSQERPGRKSISGIYIMNGESTFSWRSKRQLGVVQSFKEAEVIALSICVREVLWLKKLFKVLEEIMDEETVEDMFKTSIGGDNLACISDTRNPVFSDLPKHIYLN